MFSKENLLEEQVTQETSDNPLEWMPWICRQQQQLPAINATINLTKRALGRTARQITATSDW